MRSRRFDGQRPVLIAAALAATLSAAACSRPEPEKSAAPDMSVGSREGRFVGSAACRECHAEAFTAWEGSRHRKTLSPAAGDRLARFAAGPLPRGFSVDEATGEVRGPSPEGNAVVGSAAFVVGGRHRDDLWVRLNDGSLQVFPFSYDVDAGGLFEPIAVLSGGSSPAPDAVEFWTRAGRNADRTCYGCHATGHVLDSKTPADGGAPNATSRWAEIGVGCEGCHGPGGPHVEAAKAGRAPQSPPRLTSRDDGPRQTAVCASCHALRELLSSPIASVPAHRYGATLQAFAEPAASVPSSFEFRDAVFDDWRPGVYQQEAAALSQSPCAVKGGLACKDCHDVHSGDLTPRAAAPDRGDGICLSCHREIARDLARHTRHDAAGEGARCISCHMARIVRGPGREPARDHTLSPPVASPGQIPGACVSCHQGKDASKAAAWSGWKTSSAATARRSRYATATRAFLEGRNAAAALGAIVAEPANGWYLRTTAAARIAALFDRTPDRGATSALRETLADADPAVRRGAIRALGRSGDPGDLETLAALVNDPDPFAALDAVVATGLIGDPGFPQRLTRVVARNDLAGEYRAHLAFGRAALLSKDWARAERAFARTLEIHPFVVPAWNDLGIARRSLGREADARAAWQRALAINPRYEAARRNLAEAGGGR